MGEDNLAWRPSRKPLWWNINIGAAQLRRIYLAKKWHKVKADAYRWRDKELCENVETIHVELAEKQKITRRLSRQYQAQLPNS